MTRIENVDFGLGHVAATSLRLRKLERYVVFTPEDEKAAAASRASKPAT